MRKEVGAGRLQEDPDSVNGRETPEKATWALVNKKSQGEED